MSDPLPIRPSVPDDDLDSAKKELFDNLEKRLKECGRDGYSGKVEGFGDITLKYQALMEVIPSNDYGRVYQEVSNLAVGCIWLMATIEAMHTQELARKTEGNRKKAAEK